MHFASVLSTAVVCALAWQAANARIPECELSSVKPDDWQNADYLRLRLEELNELPDNSEWTLVENGKVEKFNASIVAATLPLHDRNTYTFGVTFMLANGEKRFVANQTSLFSKDLRPTGLKESAWRKAHSNRQKIYDLCAKIGQKVTIVLGRPLIASFNPLQSAILSPSLIVDQNAIIEGKVLRIYPNENGKASLQMEITTQGYGYKSGDTRLFDLDDVNLFDEP